MTPAALRLSDVHKSFGPTAVIMGVSLEVARGTRHAIIGPNGAGKTTLFNLISGRFPVSSGTIELNGQRIDSLQADVRSIRGEVEMLQNQTEGGKTQTRNLYGDLEKRLAALETLGGVGAAPAPGAVPGPVSGASEQITYDAGMAALRAGNYDKAISAFREVVTNYPTGELASNAQFWMGESYYTKGDLESAVIAYRKVLSDWPAARKAPDAMVKLGFSLSDLKRTGEARSTLEEVVRKFPGTPSAQLAADRLKRLGR